MTEAAGADPTAAGLPRARSPWVESRFWLLQVVVLALALIRLAVTVSFHLATTDLVLVLSTVVIFVVPVLIASLAYGLTGGIATVAWTAALCIPRIVDAADHQRTAALWAEVLQLAVLAVVAVLVGGRMSTGTRIAEQADLARTARLDAERLYQDLFESNRSPILIVDAEGFVVESNASADRVFGVGSPPRRLVDVVGPEAAALVLTRLVSDPGAQGSQGSQGTSAPSSFGDAIRHDAGTSAGADDRVPPVPFQRDGRTVLYRPSAALVGSSAGDRRMQVVFEDVTAETKRHDSMEAFAGQVVLGQEEERRHLAQELHDGPLQTLIHLCRQIDALAASGPARVAPARVGPVADGSGASGPGRDGSAPGSAADPVDASLGALASMRTTVEETVAELRSIARGLRPSVLDDLGLVASLNQVVQDAALRQGFASTFDVDGTTRRLPPEVELAAFRIGQEAITNVERHAAARHLAVRLSFDDAGLGLSVEDDGTGFDPDADAPDGPGSLGLPGMAERARLVGGRLHVRSRRGAGTTVTAWVPAGAFKPS